MSEYAEFKKFSLKRDIDYNECWVQDRIADKPSILGLGDVILRDKERIQPRAGRLDLLLQDTDGNRRYEVEIQLGATDESHIIRTIEYWDIERKRYPQYDHVAVIVAEDITGRFLNVISLFNGMIPLMAIQMSALRYNGKVGLFFTTVLDQMTLGLIDEEEEVQEATDRSYWENRASKKTVLMADSLLEIAKQFNESLELKYNKPYIGLTKGGSSTTYLTFRPQKTGMRLEIRLKRSAELDQQLEDSGLDLLDYESRWGKYRIRLQPTDLSKHEELLTQLIKEATEIDNG